jgi:FO synthase
MTSSILKAKTTFEAMLDAARRGRVTREIACSLIRAADGDELRSLLEVAGQLRDELKGRLVSYSKKVFIPLTNLCRDYCGYCTFRKDPASRERIRWFPTRCLRLPKPARVSDARKRCSVSAIDPKLYFRRCGQTWLAWDTGPLSRILLRWPNEFFERPDSFLTRTPA